MLDALIGSVLAWGLGIAATWVLGSLYVTERSWLYVLPGSSVYGLALYGWFVLWEGLRGATPLRRLLWIVVRTRGRGSLAAAARRNAWMLSAFVPFLGSIVVGVMAISVVGSILRAPDRLGWHDRFAGTQVVRTR